MELNYINSNMVNNAEKNKPEPLNNNDKLNKADINTADSLKNNPQSYKLDISGNSVKKSKEFSYYNNLSGSDKSTGAQAINDTYMSEIISRAQEKPKPYGVKMDDVSWGLLVEMGEKIGLTDTKKLVKLTVKDIEAYFYAKNITERGKNLLKGNLTANEYAEYKNTKFDSENYWNNVFDENGNKKDYSIYTINQSNTGLPLSAAEFFSNKGSIKVTDLSAASIHNILIADENKDTALFTYAVSNIALAGKEKSVYENQKEMIDAYNAVQQYAATVPSVYEQTQIIASAMKKSSLSYYYI